MTPTRELLPLSSAALTVITAVMYFSPWWWRGDPRDMLGFATLSFLWFLCAWIIALVHVGIMVALVRTRNRRWKVHLLSIIVISLGYAAVLFGMKHGYFISA